MRIAICLLLAATICSASLEARDPPYYGPIKGWNGGRNFGMGYKEEVQRDGSWRIVANTRSDRAVDMAMYRAAEMARDAGYAYVEMLGGIERRSMGMTSATLYARPSHTGTPPATCPSRKRGTCYTADVAEVMRRLGGPDGRQPGIAIVDHFDEHGNPVSYSGYGIGAVSSTPLPSPAPPPRFIPAPLPVQHPSKAPAELFPSELSRAERYDQVLKAAQPVRGREPKLGWTVSD